MYFIVIALRKTPSFHGYGPTIRKLKSLPAFWTLVLLLLLGVIRYVILEAWSQSSLSFLLRVSFILSCVSKLAIVGLFNYTQINSIRRRSPTLVLVLVKITLEEILLQSITDFCLGILQLALHADDLNHLQVGNSNNFRTVADLFRKSAECSASIAENRQHILSWRHPFTLSRLRHPAIWFATLYPSPWRHIMTS